MLFEIYIQIYKIISNQYKFFLQMEINVVKDIVDRQKLVRDRALERIKEDLTNDNNEASKSLLLARFCNLSLRILIGKPSMAVLKRFVFFCRI